MAEGKTTSKIIPVLLVVSLLLIFAVGVLWQKVVKLEKGGISDQAAEETTKESPITVEKIKKMAKDLKLEEKNFNKCLDESRYNQKVKDDLSLGEKLGVRGTPAFFINGKFLGGAYPYEIFKEIIDLELGGRGKTIGEYSEILQKAYEDKANRSFDIAPKEINLDSSVIKGDQNAPVVMVEFSDFECYYCIRHYSQTEVKIVAEYVDTGKVKIIYKHFPLTLGHPNSQKAAEAAECAGEQGKFWEMHDKLFEASAAVTQ